MVLKAIFLELVDASDDSKIRVSGSKSRVKQMHPLTLKIELADVSTNSKNGVSDCIHRLKDYFLSLWMHPLTLKIELADAAMNSKMELAIASTDLKAIFWVCECIHWFENQSW